MKWFKKKKKEEVKKLDFSGIKITLNIKSICYYEYLSGKSFFSAKMEDDDLFKLLYALIINNNDDVQITYNAFTYMIEDARVQNWCLLQLEKIRKETEQLSFKQKEDVAQSGETQQVKVTDIAMFLITKHHIDPTYVMEKMKLWEMSEMVLSCSKDTEERLTEERLWTYLTIMPHVDGKKLGGPEKLLPFPWDDKSQNAKQKEFERHAKAATMFLKGGKKDA